MIQYKTSISEGLGFHQPAKKLQEDQSKCVEHRAEKQSSESCQRGCVHLAFTVYALPIVPKANQSHLC